MKKKILAVILAALLALSIPSALVSAYYTLPLDVGNHHSYGGGGTTGGSRSHRSYSSRSRSSSSSGGALTNDPVIGGIIGIIFLGVFVSIFGLVFTQNKKANKKSSNPSNVKPCAIPHNATIQISEYIKQDDENFNTEKFLEWAKNLFITLQTAWTERDWEKIRTFEKEELFEQHNTQLQEYIRLGRINVIEDINIIDTYLHKLVVEDKFEELTVSMRATMKDYIIDEKSGKILMGNKETVFDTIYQMTFIRRKGIKTTLVDGNIVSICPHCGATVHSASAGKCEYCDSVVHIGEFNWVLSNHESVDQNFVDDTRGIIFINDGINKF